MRLPAIALAVLAVALPSISRAQPTGRPGRFLQTAEFTNVLDSFESDDPFDLNISVGYLRESRTARIRRESNNIGVSPDGYLGVVDLADYEHLQNILDLQATVAVYHDLHVWFRFPLVLSDTRELTLADGVSLDQSKRRRDCYPDDGQDVCLFDLPFRSPERSGLDAIWMGVDWGPLNQLRDETKPTWVVGLEAAVGVGEALKAAREGDDGGISRGTTLLGASTRFSRRYQFVEPYVGVRFTAELPQGDTLFPEADIVGRLNTVPPLVGQMIVGAEFVPWESLETQQRFTVDLRLLGQFNSEGRQYSELFDALGTTRHRQVRDLDAPGAEFGGQTDVENYGTFGAALRLNVQAARYVKFQLGAGIATDQAHGVTYTDACNPEAEVPVPQAPCHHGAPNPDHRPVLDIPGRRFRVEQTTVFQFFASGTATF